MTTMTRPEHVAPSPRFRASRAAPCGSDYVCEGIEIGDRVAYVQDADCVVVMCEGCADRTEAAAELAEPVEIGGPLEPPTTVAEAIERLRDEHEQTRGQYLPQTVEALLGLLDTAAEDVARFERERWSWRIRSAARQGTALAHETRAGLHMAAALIERNRENL